MTSLTADQQKLEEKIKYPKNWNNPNPSFKPAPFDYFNSYTSPSWTNGQQGGAAWNPGGVYNYSNQFTSALTQPKNPANNVPQAGRGANNPPPLDMVNPFSKDKQKKKLIKYSN